MHKNVFWKKGLVLIVIFLIVCVSGIPAINGTVIQLPSTSNYNDDNLVEISVETYGIGKPVEHKIKLTQEQAKDLKIFLESFQTQINNSASLIETINLYKEAVIELDKYGLLPQDISILEAQKLVIGPYQNPKYVEKIEKFIIDKPEPGAFDILNAFCLVYATFYNLPTIGSGMIFLILALGIFLQEIGLIDPALLPFLFMIFAFYYMAKPLFFWAFFDADSPHLNEVYSLGLMGFRHDTWYTTILGFKGLRIYNLTLSTILIGHAFLIGCE